MMKGESFVILIFCLRCATANFVSLSSGLQDCGRVQACRGEDVTYSCETNGPLLTWLVEPYITEDNAVSFSLGDSPGDSILTISEATRMLISISPTLMSTLVLSPSMNLENTTVICRTNNNQSTLLYERSVPPQPPPTIDALVENRRVVVFWDPPSDPDISHYVVLFTFGAGMDMSRTVSSTSTVLDISDIDSPFQVQVATVNECGLQSAMSSQFTVEVNTAPGPNAVCCANISKDIEQLVSADDSIHRLVIADIVADYFVVVTAFISFVLISVLFYKMTKIVKELNEKLDRILQAVENNGPPQPKEVEMKLMSTFEDKWTEVIQKLDNLQNAQKSQSDKMKSDYQKLELKLSRMMQLIEGRTTVVSEMISVSSRD